MASFFTPKQQLLVSLLEAEVAKVFELDADEYAVLLRGDRRDQRLAHARHFQWYILHDLLGSTLKLIGNTYGKDHTSVASGIASFKSRNTFHEYKEIAKKILESKDIKDLRASMLP